MHEAYASRRVDVLQPKSTHQSTTKGAIEKLQIRCSKHIIGWYHLQSIEMLLGSELAVTLTLRDE